MCLAVLVTPSNMQQACRRADRLQCHRSIRASLGVTLALSLISIIPSCPVLPRPALAWPVLICLTVHLLTAPSALLDPNSQAFKAQIACLVIHPDLCHLCPPSFARPRLHIHPSYCRPARPLFAFRVRLEDPPPKPRSTSPPISAGPAGLSVGWSWAGWSGWLD